VNNRSRQRRASSSRIRGVKIEGVIPGKKHFCEEKCRPSNLRRVSSEFLRSFNVSSPFAVESLLSSRRAVLLLSIRHHISRQTSKRSRIATRAPTFFVCPCVCSPRPATRRHTGHGKATCERVFALTPSSVTLLSSSFLPQLTTD